MGHRGFVVEQNPLNTALFLTILPRLNGVFFARLGLVQVFFTVFKKLKVSANSFGRVAENRSKLEACTKSNRAKIPAVKSSQNCLIFTMLRGFCSTTNPLCGIWIWSPLYKVMLWNQPFVVTSLQKGEVVIPGANSVQGLRQWPRETARVKKSDPWLFLWLRLRWA